MSLWTRWKEARKADPVHTDKLTKLTEPPATEAQTPANPQETGFRQYCQNVSSTEAQASGSEVLSVSSECQFVTDPVAEAVAAAFAEYAALDDPGNPEAWR